MNVLTPEEVNEKLWVWFNVSNLELFKELIEILPKGKDGYISSICGEKYLRKVVLDWIDNGTYTNQVADKMASKLIKYVKIRNTVLRS